MKRAKVLKNLIDETGMSMRSFAEKVGIPYTTLYSILERGVGKASIDNVLKICKTLGITAEEMDRLAFSKDDDIETIAAHREADDDEEWTEEELKLIEEFKEFVRSQRKQQE